ncbi:MAG: hypothetical protein ABJP02_15630 [Parasphingorhabdus sp.]|uniref:hypothetical protein n=1 Tax=Parasphingorhabdus sp. TaxID=2709688 RepID=UPI0032981182
MFGPRLTRVFASRNNALWWSAMVLVTAYCVAAEPPVMPASGSQDGAVAKIDGREKSTDPWAGMKEVAKTRQETLP